VLTAHGSDVEAPGSLVERLAKRALLRQCAGVHFVSNALAQASARMLGAPACPMLVRPIGVDLERFTPEGERLARGDRLRVVAAANLVPYKGWAELLEAVALLEARGVDVELVALGGGDHAWAAGLTAAHGVEGRVRWLGVRPPESLPEVYRSADVVAVPSHREGFGLVGLEAMACGVPVVATGVGGLADYMENGVNARLVAPRDAASLADGLAAVLADAELRATLVRGGLGTAPRYGVELAAREVKELYERALAQNRNMPPA
jgi:glycosyltransferase involved in cell wall biosynthesis